MCMESICRRTAVGRPDWTGYRRKLAGIMSEFFIEKVRWIIKMMAGSGKEAVLFAADPDFKPSWKPREKCEVTGLQPSDE